jgi:Right handed beta helix region/Bacterial Ig domain
MLRVCSPAWAISALRRRNRKSMMAPQFNSSLVRPTSLGDSNRNGHFRVSDPNWSVKSVCGLLCHIIALLFVFSGSAAAQSVVFVSPRRNQAVSGTIEVAAKMSSVVWVNFYVDGVFLRATPPSSFAWNSQTVGNGSHTLIARGFNSADRQVAADIVDISVNNDGGDYPSPSGGVAYFVSPGGNDSNPGTSQSAPWHTIKRVNSAHLRPGDVVYFRSGGWWRDTLKPPIGGKAEAPITFAAYGSGPQPVISGSDLIRGWSKYSGLIYYASAPRPVYNVFVDGGPGWGLKHAASVGSIHAGTWFWNSSGKWLYVWLPNGTSPQGHNIEAATRTNGVYVNAGNGAQLACSQKSYITIRGLTIERTGGNGIYFHCYAGPSSMNGIVIERNTIRQTGTGQSDNGQYFNGIQLLQEPPEAFTAPIIAGNVVSYTGGHGNGINVHGASYALIIGNDVSNWNHNGIDTRDASEIVESWNYVHDQPNFGAAFFGYNTESKVENNSIARASNGFQFGGGATGHVYSNSFLNVPTGIYLGPSPGFIWIMNNAASRITTPLATDGSQNFSEDYNDWDGGIQFGIGGKYYSFSQWLGMSGHRHDKSVDPRFNGGSDFSLQASSPCINAGISVGLPYQGSEPDLGAIESPW